MKEIVLVDPHSSGHHLSYLRIYCAIMLEMNFAVSILCEDCDLVKDYFGDWLAEKAGKVRVLPLLRQESSLNSSRRVKSGLLQDVLASCRVFRRFAAVAKSLRAHEIGTGPLVVFMWLDDYISKLFPGFVLDVFFRNRWGGIYFHPTRIKFDEKNRKLNRGLLHKVPVFYSSKLTFVGLFDGMMVESLQQKHGRNLFYWLPDVAEKFTPDLTSELVRDIQKVAGARKIVSLLGSLGRRKNVLSFFDAAERYSGDDVLFLCLGQLHKADFSEAELERIYSIADKLGDKLYFHDGHVVSDEIFDTLFYLSEIIVAVYDRFPSSSNLITKAAMHGKPVIVSREYLMGEVVARYDLGTCVESGNSSELLSAIERLLCAGPLGSGRFSAYLEEYSTKNLRSRFGEIMSSIDE